MNQMRATPEGGKLLTWEEEHRIAKFRGLYAADPSSGKREPTLEFIAVHGGFRTVRVKDIIDIH
jgi:hypothetical protein